MRCPGRVADDWEPCPPKAQEVGIMDDEEASELTIR
jgi:hypothetical protein